jgi:AcrR family transcriptional regulator
LAEPIRTRDPARKERILAAAACLVARHGYHAVGMSDIGAAAGITGSAIYRHFERKSAVLVALFDRVTEALLANAARVAGEGPRETLTRLVDDQVRFAVEDREVLQVYLREAHNLPNEDRGRLHHNQCLYLEEWVRVLGELRPGLVDAEARTLVHAAIGAIQSVFHHDSGLPDHRLAELVTAAAHAILTGHC